MKLPNNHSEYLKWRLSGGVITRISDGLDIWLSNNVEWLMEHEILHFYRKDYDRVYLKLECTKDLNLFISQESWLYTEFANKGII